MTDHDYPLFLEMFSGLCECYNKTPTPFLIGVYWNALKPFSLDAVQQSFSSHLCRRDKDGKFMPKPADLLELLEGTSSDNAALAWSKVDKGVRWVGPWQDIVFDDPLIHRVIDDMGGWPKMCGHDNDGFRFVGIDFQKAYNGYHTRRTRVDYPPVLTGIANQQNALSGQPLMPPRLLGDPAACQKVIAGGTNRPSLALTTAGEQITRQLH